MPLRGTCCQATDIRERFTYPLPQDSMKTLTMCTSSGDLFMACLLQHARGTAP